MLKRWTSPCRSLVLIALPVLFSGCGERNGGDSGPEPGEGETTEALPEVAGLNPAMEEPAFDPLMFPHPTVEVPGGEAVKELNRLREKGREEGYLAIMLGPPEVVESLADLQDTYQMTASDVIEKAAAVDPKEWFERQRENFDPAELEPDEELEEMSENAEPPAEVTAHRDVLTREPYEKVILAKMPVSPEEPWRVFAEMPWGGFNECPFPHEHLAIARYWHEKFGASLATMSTATLEFMVERPPQTDEEALALATEQYLYCPDIVDQGVGSIDHLAQLLKGSQVWYFWWD